MKKIRSELDENYSRWIEIYIWSLINLGFFWESQTKITFDWRIYLGESIVIAATAFSIYCNLSMVPSYPVLPKKGPLFYGTLFHLSVAFCATTTLVMMLVSGMPNDWEKVVIVLTLCWAIYHGYGKIRSLRSKITIPNN